MQLIQYKENILGQRAAQSRIQALEKTLAFLKERDNGCLDQDNGEGKLHIFDDEIRLDGSLQLQEVRASYQHNHRNGAFQLDIKDDRGTHKTSVWFEPRSIWVTQRSQRGELVNVQEEFLSRDDAVDSWSREFGFKP